MEGVCPALHRVDEKYPEGESIEDVAKRAERF
jgi:hypothetical protein